MRKVLATVAILAAVLAAYLCFWPVDIDPVAWTPMPIRGDFPVNERLAGVERLAPGFGAGPEGIALDRQGRLYTGYADGRLVRMNADGSAPEVLADTGGRPLGLAIHPDGSLVVADAHKGLLRWDGALKSLVTEVGGQPLKFADDVDISADGARAYFSDASTKYGYEDQMHDFLEHSGNGRLLEYDFAAGTTRVLLDGLHFANGIALGPDEAYVLVNETGEYRIRRYWLKGEKAGTQEVFRDGLPGFPDNVTYDGAGRFWVAIYAPRTLDGFLAGPAFVRKLGLRLPKWVQPAPVRHAFVIGLDLEGKVIADLQHPGADSFSPITSARRSGDWLYLGSLSYPAVGRIRVP